MNRHIRIEPEASAELEEAVLWYDEQHGGLGSELLDAIDGILAHIDRWPEAAPAVPRVAKDVVARKAPVKRFPYSVVYLVSDEAIRVLAFAHDRRKPSYWHPRIVPPTGGRLEGKPSGS